MKTQKKIEKLKSEGWNIVFNDAEFMHEADRGVVKYKYKNITSLYKSIKNDFKQAYYLQRIADMHSNFNDLKTKI